MMSSIVTQSYSSLYSPGEEYGLSEELLSSIADLPSSGSPRKRKRIPYTLVEASKGNKCPTSGCNGLGHITGLYAMHYAVSGCPLAHGKTPEECKVRYTYINPLFDHTYLGSERGIEQITCSKHYSSFRISSSIVSTSTEDTSTSSITKSLYYIG